MEENGELGVITLIMNANNLSDLLTLFDDAGDIMKSDVELYEDYIEDQQLYQVVFEFADIIKTGG